MTIFIEDSFDSAHWLPNVPPGHKCGSMHGHTYRVHIEITADIDDHSGWVGGYDYADIKYAWSIIKADLDHHVLNDYLANPTCELIAEHIASRMKPTPTRVELRETERCGAIWTK